MPNDYRQPIARACDCAACRARTDRDFWAIVRATWQPSDDDDLERAAVDGVHETWEAARLRALARGTEDGA